MADSRTVIQARYDSKNRKSFAVKLNYNYDQDIIDKLATVESVNGYIKQLVRDDITRTNSAPKTETEEKHMMYHIKPEYLDMWEGGDTPSNPDRIITEEDLRTFSEEWETPIETLLEQLIPIE